MPESGRKILLTLLEAEEKKTFPENHFSIEGMNLPVGTLVNDHSNYKILGYWDGGKISKDFVPKERGPNRRTRRLYLILLAIVLIPALGIAAYKSRRHRGQTTTPSI